MGTDLDFMHSGQGDGVLDGDGYQRLLSWAAIVFLWGLGIFEHLTLSFYRRYR